MRLAVWDRPGEFETGLDVLLAHFAAQPGDAEATTDDPRPAPLRVKMISPAKTAADSRYWRSIKYSLFPPLGLATLAGVPGPGRRGRPAGRARRDAAPRRRARPRRHRGVHHLGRARLPLRRPLPRQGRLRLPRRPAPDEPAGRGRPARRQRVLRPGRRHLAGVPRATSAPAGPSRSTAPPSARSPACRRRAATSSSASATSCPTRWS